MFGARESPEKDLPEMKGQKIGGTLVFFINMTGIANYLSVIKDNVTIVKDQHETFYGKKEFAIKDLNGYYLVFAEDIQK